MKIIKYKLHGNAVTMPYSEANEEMAKKEADDGEYTVEDGGTDEQAVRMEIQDLKAKLAATDYQAIKYAEGLISAEDYEPIKAQRQAWRDQINILGG